MGTPWENGDLYGKLTVCYGKSPFLMGKSTTVSRAIFNSYVKLPECNTGLVKCNQTGSLVN